MSVAKRIAGRTTVYGLGAMLRALSSFLLLPLYTAYLTPADYGLVELMSIIVDLTTILLGSRVAVGIFKYYSDASDATEKSRVIGSALILLLAVNSLSVAILYVAADGIAGLLQAPREFPEALRIFSLVLIFGAINEVFFSYLRIKDNPVRYVSASILKLLAQLSLNILFIVFMEMGFWGIVWGAVLSNAVVTIVFALWLLPEVGFHASWEQGRNLVKFSLPIIFSSIGMYYITFGDRYFLQLYEGIAVVGVYAIAYKFGFMLFSLVWGPFSTYWSAQQFEYAKLENAGELFGNVFFFANVILLTAATGILVLAPHFIHLFSQPAYLGAIELIPWIVVAYIFQCWTEYTRFGILQAAATRFIAYATLLTVVCITIFYLYWIPREGAVGAAKATLAAFAVRFYIVYYFSQRLFPMQIPWYRLFFLIAYFAVVYLVLNQLVLADAWAMPVKGILILLAMAGLLFMPIINADHRSVVWSEFARLRSSLNA